MFNDKRSKMSRQQLLQLGIAVTLIMLFLVGCGNTATTSVSEAPAATPTPEPPTPSDEPKPEETVECEDGTVSVAQECVVASDLRINCEKLSDIHRGFCEEMFTNRLALVNRYVDENENPSDVEQTLLSQSMIGFLGTVEYLEQNPEPVKKMLCRRRWNGKFVCLSTEKLLAFYDTEMSITILRDLENLQNRNKHLQEGNGVLIRCDQNAFTDIDVDHKNIAELFSYLEDHLEEIDVACAEAQKLFESTAGDNSLSGFSGITGIGSSLGLTDICGGPLVNSTFEALDDMVEITEAHYQFCGGGQSDEVPNIPETLYEGGSNDQQASADIQRDADGNITGVKYTDSQTGETVEIEFTDDGPVVTSTGSSPSGDMQVTTHADGTSTSTLDTQGRTLTVQSDSNGNYQGHTDVIRAQDGDNVIIKRNEFDANGDLIKTEEVHANLVNGDVKHLSKDYDQGIDTFSVWNYKGGTNGGRWERKRKDGGDWDSSIGPIDCNLDPETCSQCSASKGILDEAHQDCLENQPGQLCRELTSKYNCCATENPLVNPTIIMPNPMNDMMCVTQNTVDPDEGQCKLQCQFAYHEDCISNCLSRSEVVFDWDLIDAACIYMYSEECAYGDEQPIDVGVPAGGPPIPSAIQIHSIVPIDELGMPDPQR